MHQRRDRETRIGRATQFLGKNHRRAGVHRAAAIFLRIADAQKAKLSHLAQDLTRDAAVLFPLIGGGVDFLGDEAADLVAQHLVLFVQEQGIDHGANLLLIWLPVFFAIARMSSGQMPPLTLSGWHCSLARERRGDDDRDG